MGFDRRNPLYHSISATVGVYGSIEIAFFFIVAYISRFTFAFVITYLLIQIVFHIIILFFLTLASTYFRLSNTGEQLLTVNVANKITLFRISMLPTLLYLILAMQDHNIGIILFITILITFLTDLIDGQISRRRNQVTHIGKILDSVSDYSLLIVVAIAYRIFDLVPIWLFWIIVFRLFFQAIGMLILLIVYKKVEPKPTIFGKITIATTMTLFAMEPLRLIVASSKEYLPYIEYAAGIIVALSILDKGYFFKKQHRKNIQ